MVTCYTHFFNYKLLLRADGWGSKYPLLMNNLYQGKLNWNNAANEIIEIREGLPNYKPSQVI